MRALWHGIAVALLIGGLGACASPQGARLSDSAHASRCEAVASRPLAFSSRRAADTLEARASGASCAQTEVTVVLRLPDGRQVLAFSLPLPVLLEGMGGAQPATQAQLAALLRRYVDEAQLDARPGALPVWKKGEPTPGFDQGMELTSPLSRKRYAALRSARPNLLCLRDAQESFSCHVWDRKQRRAEVILQH
jgi:hypothetical protein